MKPFYAECTDIPDAWFTLVYNIFDYADNPYIIQHGSYVGQKRLEYDYMTVRIKFPQHRPLEPDIPAHFGIPNPVETGYIEEKYVPYVMTDRKEPGEDYTYGQRINGYDHTVRGKGFMECRPFTTKIDQVEYWIRLLKEKPNTNQAILQVGAPQDCKLDDPPCLRHIDLRVKNGKLHFIIYFRSWDLWNGFPANLGGFTYLQKYMADEIGVDCGEFICSSKGLHLYDYVWELAEARTGKTLKQFKEEDK